jgi:hypothetical protein
MQTILAVLLFVAVFGAVLYVIVDRKKSTTLPHNGGTGVGGGGDNDDNPNKI